MHAVNSSISLIRGKELPAAKPPLVSLLRYLKPTVLVRQRERARKRDRENKRGGGNKLTLIQKDKKLNGK